MDHWFGLAKMDCLQTLESCFCEALRDSWIAEPVNTWSNVALALVGLWIFLAAVERNRNKGDRRFEVFRVVSGISMIMVGIGSWIMHASQTYVGSILDWMGMFAILSAFLAYALTFAYNRSAKFFLAVWATSTLIGTSVAAYDDDLLARIVWGGLIFVIIAFELIQLRFNENVKEGAKYLWMGLGIMALSYFLWILDKEGVVCNPNSYFQLHAVWHLLSAAAGYVIYRYGASKRYIEEGTADV